MDKRRFIPGLVKLSEGWEKEQFKDIADLEKRIEESMQSNTNANHIGSNKSENEVNSSIYEADKMLAKDMYSVLGAFKAYEDMNGTDEDYNKYLKALESIKKIDEINAYYFDIRDIISQEIDRIQTERKEIKKEELQPYKIRDREKLAEVFFDCAKKIISGERINFASKLEQAFDQSWLVRGVMVGRTEITSFVRYAQSVLTEIDESEPGTDEFDFAVRKFFEMLLQNEFFDRGGEAWILYLLSLINDGEQRSNDFEALIEDFDTTNYFDERIETVYQIETERLLQQQTINSGLSLYAYYFYDLKSEKFYKEKEIKRVVEIIRSSKVLEERYLDTSIWGGIPKLISTSNGKKKKSGTGCFALMKVKNNKYIAFSGLDKDVQTEAAKRVQSMLGTSYTFINDDAPYYIENGRRITKYELQNSYALTNSERKKVQNGSFNRMFSCCERKFVNHLMKNEYHVIFVKYEPCYMCERMLEREEKRYKCAFQMIAPCGTGREVNKTEKDQYDDIATRAIK